jgi:hypothetical protein
MARLLPYGGPGRFVLPVLVAGAALIAATGASAGPGISTTTPFFYSNVNPCTLEPFEGTGQLHLLFSQNVSSSGRLQAHIEATFSGLQATTVTGKKYVVVSQENQTNTFDSTDVGPAHETVEHTVQFVRSGEDGTLLWGDDFYEHFLAHITANANGVVTVQDVTTETRCR